MFDRAGEWQELSDFVGAGRSGSALALVYGRRRQGKSFLLDAVTEAAGGFMFTGLEQSATQNLARLAEEYGRFTGSPAPVRFDTWAQAITALMTLGADRPEPIPVVLDEFPYLLNGAPELPSLIQDAFRPRSEAVTTWRTRLVLCGSALSVMRGLLAGTAPLRGRASLELMVHPFGFRQAAEFWGVDDWDVAARLHALVGGTPAYREMSGAAAAPTRRTFDDWVAHHLLRPSSALFREGHVLLAEEPRIADASLYFSVLGAIAAGRTRRGEIANAVGRKETALAHPLAVLEEARLVDALGDALRDKRTSFRLAEPMMRLHQLVIARDTARLGRGQARAVWAQAADTVSARIYGPHFEDLARTWALEYADPAVYGGTVPSRVAPTVVACREHKVNHEIDLVAVRSGAGEPDCIVGIGEAKWQSNKVGESTLHHLEHLRTLLPAAADARLFVFSRKGFTAELVAGAEQRSDVQLIDLERMYTGS